MTATNVNRTVAQVDGFEKIVPLGKEGADKEPLYYAPRAAATFPSDTIEVDGARVGAANHAMIERGDVAVRWCFRTSAAI